MGVDAVRENTGRKGNWWLGGAVVFVSLTLVAGSIALFALDRLLEHETIAHAFPPMFVVCIVVTVVCSHQWSLYRVLEVSMAYANGAFSHKCHYCRAPKCHIVCKDCQSIQWETLREWSGKIKTIIRIVNGIASGRTRYLSFTIDGSYLQPCFRSVLLEQWPLPHSSKCVSGSSASMRGWLTILKPVQYSMRPRASEAL